MIYSILFIAVLVLIKISSWVYKGAKVVYIPLKANGIQSILYDIVSICHAIFKADVLLVLGVSGCIILPLIRLFSRKNINCEYRWLGASACQME